MLILQCLMLSRPVRFILHFLRKKYYKVHHFCFCFSIEKRLMIYLKTLRLNNIGIQQLKTNSTTCTWYRGRAFEATISHFFIQFC